MRRPVVLTMAVAVWVTGVAVIGQRAASGDVECRYAVPMQSPAPGDATVPDLPADVFQQVRYADDDSPHLRSFELRRARWSVVAIRPSAGVDHDLAVYECPGHEPLRRSASTGSSVDFVALDGSRAWSQVTLFAEVRQVSRLGGGFGLEYSTGVQGPGPGESQTLLMKGTPALVRDVYVDSGTTAILKLGILSGDADLAVVDTGDGRAGWVRSRQEAVALSANEGDLAEVVTIGVPRDEPGRTFGIVVVNNASSGEYLLSRH